MMDVALYIGDGLVTALVAMIAIWLVMVVFSEW